MITPLEAARLIGCTRQNVTTLCRRGVFSATKHGGVWLIDRASVESYLAQRKEGQRARDQ